MARREITEQTLLTEKEIQAFTTELETHRDNIQLDADPASAAHGLDSLLEKLSSLAVAREKITSILITSTMNKVTADTSLTKKRSTYEQEFNRLLATDATARTQKSVDLRKAHIENALDKQIQERDTAVIEAAKAAAFHQIATAVLKDIDSKKDSLEGQITTIGITRGISASLHKATHR